jgi:hypothetical protein
MAPPNVSFNRTRRRRVLKLQSRAGGGAGPVNSVRYTQYQLEIFRSYRKSIFTLCM